MRSCGLAVIALLAGMAQAQPILLSTSGPVQDQGKTPTCWAHAWIGYLNHRLRQPNGAAADFSVDYLLYHDLRARALSGIVAARERRVVEVFGGGTSERAFAISREHGLLPTSQWTPKEPLTRYYPGVLSYIDRVASYQKRVHADEVYLSRIDKILEQWFGRPPAPECADHLARFEQWRYRIDSPGVDAWTFVGQATERKLITRGGELASFEDLDHEVCIDKQNIFSFLRRQIEADRPTLLAFNTHDGEGKRVYNYETSRYPEPTYQLRRADQSGYSMGHGLVLIGFDGEMLIAEDSRGDARYGTARKRLSPEFWREHLYSITELRGWEERELSPRRRTR